MLPWPQRLQIASISLINSRELQQHAAAKLTPCVIFAPRPLPPSVGSAGQEQNEGMYRSLCRSLEGKKSVRSKILDSVSS